MSPIRFDAPDLTCLHRTFHEAFADYAVDVSGTTERRLQARMIKNNVDGALSVGAFDGSRMVGFTLIGLGRREGEPAAFDAATGVVPGYRGRGLARRMLEHALPQLGRRGVRRFLLEVLENNEPAIRAYRRCGFEIIRRLDCFTLPVGASHPTLPTGETWPVSPVGLPTVLGLADQVDWTPSWENDSEAMRRIPDTLAAFGAHDGKRCVGVIVYSPLFNWIMTLVVRRSHRRHGVASALLGHLARERPSGVEELRMLNVDASDAGSVAFAGHAGFLRILSQYEMSRPVGQRPADVDPV